MTVADVIAVGHGRTGNGGSISMQLNYAELKTKPLKDCNDFFTITITYDTFVCAQSAKDNQSVCTGDSGGPLFRKSDNTLIGVVDLISAGKIAFGQLQGGKWPLGLFEFAKIFVLNAQDLFLEVNFRSVENNLNFLGFFF